MNDALQLIINDLRTLKSLQDEFCKEFPFLKIEFFKYPHQKDQSSMRSSMLNSDKIIKECRKILNAGKLIILENQTVFEVENNFYNQFGLAVQVFRKSGRAWLETTSTDDWTLMKQNHEAEELSNILHSKKLINFVIMMIN